MRAWNREEPGWFLLNLPRFFPGKLTGCSRLHAHPKSSPAASQQFYPLYSHENKISLNLNHFRWSRCARTTTWSSCPRSSPGSPSHSRMAGFDSLSIPHAISPPLIFDLFAWLITHGSCAFEPPPDLWSLPICDEWDSICVCESEIWLVVSSRLLPRVRTVFAIVTPACLLSH